MLLALPGWGQGGPTSWKGLPISEGLRGEVGDIMSWRC